MEIVVRKDVQDVAREAAERVVMACQRAIAERGRFTFALSGGSTPEALYKLLASPAIASRVDWSRTFVFFGDERCVPPDHEWSNFAMAQRTLLDRVPIRPENVNRIAGELPPAEAAAEYTAAIREVLATPAGAEPRFDFILLGMGDDGHTASLFPGMPVLSENEAWVAETEVPGYVRPPLPRVTLTFPVLNAAREVLFLVAGRVKAEPVRKVVLDAQYDADAAALPAARVHPHDGLLTWLLDEAAAALLKGAGHG